MTDSVQYDGTPAGFPPGGLAVIVGASGAIGNAVASRLEEGNGFAAVIQLSRRGARSLDLNSEASIAEAAMHVADLASPLRLVVDATGFLHDSDGMPEKSWREIDPVQMAKAFAINAIGPSLLMKHFLPLMPRAGKSVFATISAKVGSIGDNHLGGWYSYRASKAALNQLVRTAAVELKRRKPEAICVALHPGTVDSRISAPFRKAGLEVGSPVEAAERLINVILALAPEDSGGFFDYRGARLPW